MRIWAIVFLLLALIFFSNWSSRPADISSCNFEVRKLDFAWRRSLSSDGMDSLTKYSLLEDCIRGKGWVFDYARANRSFREDNSYGLVEQALDAKNWQWGFGGLVGDTTEHDKNKDDSKPVVVEWGK